MKHFQTLTDRPTKAVSPRHFALITLLACSSAFTTAAGQSGLTAVSLKVTVNANQQFDPLTGTSTDVAPDSFGQYIDGQSGVCASFDTTGNLILNFDCKRATNPRRLALNLTSFIAGPTNGTNTCPVPSTISPTGSPAYTDYIATLPATDRTSATFQTMAVYDGTSSTTYYVQFHIATQFSDATNTMYRLNYHRTASDNFADAALASYAQVRRLSSTKWVVEPVTPSGLTNSGNPPNIAMLVWVTSLHNQQTLTECGFYQVPFSFTLEKN